MLDRLEFPRGEVDPVGNLLETKAGARHPLGCRALDFYASRSASPADVWSMIRSACPLGHCTSTSAPGGGAWKASRSQQ
jgi:hypothetical protein